MCCAEKHPSRRYHVGTYLVSVWVVNVASRSSSFVSNEPPVVEPVESVVVAVVLSIGRVGIVAGVAPGSELM